MKKFLMMAVMAVLAFTASAQVEEGFRMGVQVNGGLSNVCYGDDKATFGFGLGWIAEYNFSSELFLQSGVGLQNVAHKEDGIDGTLNAYYAQVPIHIGYRFPMGDNSFFVQAGPTVAVGLFGSKIEWGNGGSSDYFDLAKRFDLGLGGRVGMEFGSFQVSLGANYGLLKAFEVGGHNLSVNVGLALMF